MHRVHAFYDISTDEIRVCCLFRLTNGYRQTARRTEMEREENSLIFVFLFSFLRLVTVPSSRMLPVRRVLFQRLTDTLQLPSKRTYFFTTFPRWTATSNRSSIFPCEPLTSPTSSRKMHEKIPPRVVSTFPNWNYARFAANAPSYRRDAK